MFSFLFVQNSYLLVFLFLLACYCEIPQSLIWCTCARCTCLCWPLVSCMPTPCVPPSCPYKIVLPLEFSQFRLLLPWLWFCYPPNCVGKLWTPKWWEILTMPVALSWVWHFPHILHKLYSCYPKAPVTETSIACVNWFSSIAHSLD